MEIIRLKENEVRSILTEQMAIRNLDTERLLGVAARDEKGLHGEIRGGIHNRTQGNEAFINNIIF